MALLAKSVAVDGAAAEEGGGWKAALPKKVEVGGWGCCGGWSCRRRSPLLSNRGCRSRWQLPAHTFTRRTACWRSSRGSVGACMMREPPSSPILSSPSWTEGSSVCCALFPLAPVGPLPPQMMILVTYCPWLINLIH